MNQKNVMTTLAILTCIGTPLGLWIRMQVKDAEHSLQIKANEKAITELKIENKELRKELGDTKAYFEEEVKNLGDKIDEVPKKVFDLMNSVNQANKSSGRGR